MSVLGMALDEKVCFRALRSLKKYDPGAQCEIEYYVMYWKFARMQKCESLRFGNFVVPGKKAYTCYKLIHGYTRNQK